MTAMPHINTANNIEKGTIFIEDLEIGMTRELSKTIGDYEIEQFAELSTDYNPVHLDDDYAEETMFGGRIAHGMLTASLISAIIGEQLPGHGTIYLKQDIKFIAPVRPGDRVLAQVSVAEIDHMKRRVTLNCVCKVQDKPVLTGQAIVLAPSKKLD